MPDKLLTKLRWTISRLDKESVMIVGGSVHALLCVCVRERERDGV